ncbi:MAG: hypothetical protein U5L45_14705 [Saprospiraceae bacterium]|nr:hypothetical protein [Saprospiraceae bacterium]
MFCARFARAKGRRRGRFSASPKTNHISPSRERSEREMQKTLLGYAHPSSN